MTKKHLITRYKKRLLPLLMVPVALVYNAYGLTSMIANAATPVTADEYCKKYSVNDEWLACRDGWNGNTDCSDYLAVADQKHVDICNESARARNTIESQGGQTASTSNSQVGSTTSGTTPTTPIAPQNTNSSNSGQMDVLTQLIQQTGNQISNGGLPSSNPLSSGSSNNVGPNFSAPDNLYNSYVNGAGQQQPFKLIQRASSNNAPVIVFINGGGFHNDDGAGEKLAGDAAKQGYTLIVASYRLGSAGLYYMYEDVLRAVRHVRNNANMYGIDPGRIVLWGDSAGGSLAMRVATSGKAGVKAAVGWSAPTNAYTILFNSIPDFADAIDHSTCLSNDPATSGSPTSSYNGGNIPGLSQLSGLTGMSSVLDQLPNGSDLVGSDPQLNPLATLAPQVTQAAQSASGTGSTSSTGTSATSGSPINVAGTTPGINGIYGDNPVTGVPNPFSSVIGNLLSSAIGSAATGSTPDPTSAVLSTLMLSQYGLQNGSSASAVASQLQGSGLAGNTVIPGVGNLSSPLPGSNLMISPSQLNAKTFLKCIDNLNAASPALYASPLSPPTFLAGWDTDPVVPPSQLYDLRDKLHSLGIASDVKIGHSNVRSFMPEGGKNHCDFCKEFVQPSFDFINKVIHPKGSSS